MRSGALPKVHGSRPIWQGPIVICALLTGLLFIGQHALGGFGGPVLPDRVQDWLHLQGEVRLAADAEPAEWTMQRTGLHGFGHVVRRGDQVFAVGGWDFEDEGLLRGRGYFDEQGSGTIWLWNSDRQVTERLTFVLGRFREHQFFHPNGNCRMAIGYDGPMVKEGSYMTFSSEGKVLLEGQYEQDRRVGVWRKFDGDMRCTEWRYRGGEVCERRQLLLIHQQSRPHGEWVTWHDNGQLASVKQYESGVAVGDWVFYDSDGDVLHEEHYSLK